MVGGGVGAGVAHSSLSFGVALSMLWLSSSDDEKTALAAALQVGIGGSKVGGGVVIRRGRGLKNASDLSWAAAGALSFS